MLYTLCVAPLYYRMLYTLCVTTGMQFLYTLCARSCTPYAWTSGASTDLSTGSERCGCVRLRGAEWRRLRRCTRLRFGATRFSCVLETSPRTLMATSCRSLSQRPDHTTRTLSSDKGRRESIRTSANGPGIARRTTPCSERLAVAYDEPSV